MQTSTRLDKFKRRTIKDQGEWDRLLMQYGGIFKHSIPEMAAMIKRTKPQRNYSR